MPTISVTQNYQDLAGNPLSNGFLLIRLLSDAQSPAGQICSSTVQRFTLDSGGNTTGLHLWPNASLNTGSGTNLYHFSAFTSLGQLVWQGTMTIASSLVLVSIAVTPANDTIDLVTILQYIATGTYSDSSTQDLTLLVTWSGSNLSGIATLSSTGLLTPVDGNESGGPLVTITATLGSISGSTGLVIDDGSS
jgi:hypothetical protein